MTLEHGGVVARLWISAAWLVSACIVVPAAQAAEEASAFDGRAALQLDGIVGNPDYAVEVRLPVPAQVGRRVGR